VPPCARSWIGRPSARRRSASRSSAASTPSRPLRGSGAVAEHDSHYRQIAAEVTHRWAGWRVVDVDYDELEDYRAELTERGLAGSTLNQRRAVLSGIFERARRDFRVNVDPLHGFERGEVKDSGDFDVYSVD
jgi:hypothetical protein